MNSPDIRPLAAQDRARLERFFSEMDAEGRAFFNRGNYNYRRAMRFFTAQNDRGFLRWIALDGDEIAGFVFLWDADTAIPWLGVAVAERLRGRHFGQTLVEYAADWCRCAGKGGLMLTTSFANVRAQVLYERCGFRRLGTHAASGELMYLLRF